MNKEQLEAEKAKLADEKKVLQALKKQYEQAANDVQGKINIRTNKINILLEEIDEMDEVQRSILQSQVYQLNFQKQLKAQIDETVKRLNNDQYKTISEYLEDCYTTSLAGAAYDLHGQGIPLISPIDKKAMVKAVTLDPKISKKLYGSYMDEMKDSIRAEISRGIATADSFENIARNISNRTNQSFNRTMRIVRTEGHAVQIQATWDNVQKAKSAGADILKQWDATLDGRTRDSHRRVDGEIREIDEKFSNGMMYPSDSAGGAAEVINCRCSLLQRARWNLDDDELEVLKKRAEYFGLDKTEDFYEFKEKYLKAADPEVNDTDVKAIFDYMSAKSYVVNDKLRRNVELTPEEERFTIELDNALVKMPKHEGTLTRSVHFTSQEALAAFLVGYKIGEPMTYKEYLSTTKGAEYNPEAQVLIYIEDAENGRDISEYNEAEQEVLYERNATFYVENVVMQDGKWYILMVEKNE